MHWQRGCQVTGSQQQARPRSAAVPGGYRKGSLLTDWLSTTDHKIIGHLYLITSFGFFLAAGLMAMVMRAQLLGPEEQYNQHSPSHGVKIPPVPEKPRRIITSAQFDRLYQTLPDADTQLLIETDIESGLRWGELTELRVRDLDLATGILTVSRAVVELFPDDHPDGGRFLVKDYPKDKEYRRFKLSQQIVTKTEAHISARGLGDDDLLFTYQALQQPATRTGSTTAAPPPRMTEPDDKGRQYRHGTLTAYNAARCRCEHCRGAYAAYRAARRAAGKDQPRRPRVRDTDGHIPPTGSTTRYGGPPARHAASPASASMTSATPTRRGSFTGAPTCRS